MTDYTINVTNQSNDKQVYLLFSEAPKASTNVGEAWSNVWMASKIIQPTTGHDKAIYTITMNNFAVCGTTPESLGDGVTLANSDWVAVDLAGITPGTVPFMEVDEGSPGFTTPFGTTTLANSFGIKTDKWNPQEYTNIYCGYGKYDDSGNVVPVSVWTAEPSKTYELTPLVSFYISTGDYQPGTVVDKTTLGLVCEIDFTQAKAGQTVANIVNNLDNTYSLTFDYPTQRRDRLRHAGHGGK